MREKFITIFIAILILVTGFIVWRVNYSMTDDKLAWLEAKSRSQIGALVQSLEIELKDVTRTIGTGISDLSRDDKKEFSKDSLLSDFQLVAKLNLSGGELLLGEKYFQTGSSIKSWIDQYASLALKTIKPGDIPANSVAVYSILDPQRKTYFLTVLHSAKDQSWYLGVVTPEIFQSLMDRQKGQLSTMYIVNQLGQALGHTTSEYVGSLLTEEPLVAQIMKNPSLSGSQIYDGLSGDKVQGVFEQVANSNIYAVVLNPMTNVAMAKNNLIFQIALISLGFTLIGIALIYMLYKPDIVRVPSMPSVAKETHRESSSDKSVALVPIASALANEIKGPIVSILAHVRLLKLEPQRSGVHSETIEKEAQTVRELIQKLFTFAGEESEAQVETNLYQLVDKALKPFEAKMNMKGVTLTKNIIALQNINIYLQPLQMTKLVQNLINNSLQAMDRVPHKEISVIAKENGSQLELNFSDTGEGISNQNLERVFDPFFTTRALQGHTGLGLSFAFGVVRQLEGDIKIESEAGKGTQVKISIPLKTKSAKAYDESMDEKTADIILDAPAAPYRSDDGKASKEDFFFASPLASLATPPQNPLEMSDSIDKIIDDMDDEKPSAHELSLDAKKINNQDAKFPPLPEISKIEDLDDVLPAESRAPVQISKIDEPHFEKPKSASKADKVEVKIRKPGSHKNGGAS